VHDQLFYWDLLELGRRFHFLIPPSRAREDFLTPRQLAERHAFLREGVRGGALWLTRNGVYRPIAQLPPARPFYELDHTEPQPGSEVGGAEAQERTADSEIRGAEAQERTTDPEIRGAEAQERTADPEIRGAEAQERTTDPADTDDDELETPLDNIDPVKLCPTPGPGEVRPAPVQSVECSPPPVVSDNDQEAVVAAPLKARMLVLAPPGTGKTYTLINRVKRLVEAGEASAPGAITILSFTRAAVAEVRMRISAAVSDGAADDLRYVAVRTFDSFTTQMLRLDLQPDQMPHGYDARRRRLRNGLQENQLPKAAEEIDRIRCLLVDEVQDLVGEQADLVRFLVRRVERSGGGIVLFGDFAQAIYDYQIKGESNIRRSKGFLEFVRSYFEDELVCHELRTNYRVTNAAMRQFVEKARAAMGVDGVMPDGQRLGELLQQLSPPMTLDSIRPPNQGKRVAFLFRANLQAYHFSEWCQKQSLPCVTIQGATSSYVPGWIGRLSLGWASRMMSRNDAAKRWEALVSSDAGVSFDEAFARLERARVVVGDQIDMSALSRAVLEQRQELTAQNTSTGGLYVSTIHKSKGLEFDEVYLFNPSIKRATWQGNPEEVRVYYVAATRAKSHFALLQADSKSLGMEGRWTRSPVNNHPHRYDESTGSNRVFLDGLAEVDGDSLLDDLPGEAAGTCQERIARRQQALWECFVRGDRSMTARIAEDSVILTIAGPGSLITPVCRASAALGFDILGLNRVCRFSLSGLFGIPVCALATVAYPPDDTEATDLLGAARLLLAPVPRGWATSG